MTTIWKYAMIDPEPHLYVGDKVIHVGSDPAGHPDIPYVWLEVTESGAEHMRRLMWVGTGSEVPEDGVHVGSVVTPVGYVWHVYELGAS